MKTLLNNFATKLILPIAAAGSFWLGGCNQEKSDEKYNQLKTKYDSLVQAVASNKIDSTNVPKPKELTALEKYNLKNKKVYDDFYKFCTENPNKRQISESPESLYRIDIDEIILFFSKDDLHFLAEKNFHDYGWDGLDSKGLGIDSRTFSSTAGMTKNEFMKDLSIEKQLEATKEYTEALKKRMHDEGVPGY